VGPNRVNGKGGWLVVSHLYVTVDVVRCVSQWASPRADLQVGGEALHSVVPVVPVYLENTQLWHNTNKKIVRHKEELNISVAAMLM
jgi:hypothetical protein